MKITKLFGKGLLLASLLALPLTQQSHATGSSGTDHGYYWSWWINKGSASMTFNGASTYGGLWQFKWSVVSDALGGKGWNPGSNTRSIHYNAAAPSTYSNFGGYGWAPYPTYEMYVQERITSQSAGSATYKGSINSDGGTYKVYLGTQASYSGGGKQYISKRTANTSSSGNYTITTNNHMSWWASHGMSHGTWREWQLTVEHYGSNVSGSYSANVW